MRQCVCVCVCQVLPWEKSSLGCWKKQEGMSCSGLGRADGGEEGGKSTERRAHYITSQEVCSRERECDRERQTIGRHACTVYLRYHPLRLFTMLLRCCPLRELDTETESRLNSYTYTSIEDGLLSGCKHLIRLKKFYILSGEAATQS